MRIPHRKAGRKLGWLFCVLCLVLGSVVGTAAAQTTVTIAEVNDLTTLDPAYTTDNTSIAFHQHIYEGLIRFGPDGNFEPVLAERWEVDSTGTVWTFYLRKNVRFSDGTPFDAEAVKFTFDRLLDPANASPGRGRFLGLAAVEVVDSHTVQLITDGVWTPLLDNLAGPSALFISPEAVRKYGNEIGRNPVGTGPYILESWRVGQEATLVRNPNYWGEQPAVDRIVFRPVPEADVRVSLLQTGEVDIALKIPPEAVPRVEADPRLRIETPPSAYQISYIMNLKRPALQDVRVRKALNLAVDRRAIIDGILDGFGDIPHGPFTAPVPLRKVLEPYPYDPEQARALLREAGYDNNLTLTMWTSPRYHKDKEIAEAIQAYLAMVGVTVNIEVMDWGTYWNLVNQRDKQVDLYVMGASVDTPDYRLQWNWGKTAGGYWGGYVNEEFWELLDRAGRTIDPDERAELYGRLQEMVWNDHVYMFMYDAVQIIGMRKDLTGFKITGREMWDLRDVRFAER